MISAERKAQAVDAAPVGVVIADAQAPDMPLVFVNEAFEQITGYDRSEIMGRNCRFLQGPDTDPAAPKQLREAIAANEQTSVELRNYRKNGEAFWNAVTIAPIRDPNGDVTHFVGFQVDVTDRKTAEIALEQRRAALEKLVSRLHGLIQDVTEALMRGVEREPTEEAICEQVIQAEPYTFAAVGEIERSTSEIVLTTSAGRAPVGPADRFPIDVGDGIGAAVAEQEIVVSEYGEAEVGIASVPLTYRDRQFGVLIVGADTPDTFDGRERAVLEALGNTIAIAIDASQSREILAGDNIVELKFRSNDDNLLFLEIARAGDASLTFEGAASVSGSGMSMFFTADRPIAAVIDAMPEHRTTIKPIVDEPGHRLFAIDSSDAPFLTEIAARGGDLRSMSADDTGCTLTIDVRKPADPRDLADWLTTTYPETELTGYQESGEPRMHVDTSLEQLTERQRAAIRLAYTSGYYNNSRAVTGDTLAEVMDISRATFHEHLRAAERKVIGEVVGSGDVPDQ